MGEINHCWTLWTSLLQQVPHGVNLSQTEVVVSLGSKFMSELLLNYNFQQAQRK